MAIEQHIFNVIKQLAPCKALFLGYPDLLLTDDSAQSAEATSIAKWHSWKSTVADTQDVFAKIGLDAVYIDIHASRGIERIVDLNQPLPVDLVGAFDLVADPGTIEHCFNVSQAFNNLMTACKVGGHVIHTNPINMINHGFWSISPTTYVDLYTANGWSIEELSAYGGDINDRNFFEISHPYQRTKISLEISSFVVAKKITQQDFTYPTQHKYRVNPELKSHVA